MAAGATVAGPGFVAQVVEGTDLTALDGCDQFSFRDAQTTADHTAGAGFARKRQKAIHRLEYGLEAGCY
jgi:hypothetical protein